MSIADESGGDATVSLSTQVCIEDSQLAADPLTLERDRWYAWQAIDSAHDAPFRATPVLITDIDTLKSGGRLLQVAFVRLIAPLRAVQECQTWRIDYRSTGALFGTTVDATPGHEQLLVLPLTFEWLRQVQPAFSRRFDGSWVFQDDNTQIQDYMHWHFGANVDLVLGGVSASFWPPNRLPGFASVGTMKFERLYQGLDAWLLLRGFQAHSSDDKWLIHVEWDGAETGSIFVRRTAGAILYWEVPFWVDGRNVRTEIARVNLDSSQHSFGSRKHRAQQLDAVLRGILLGDLEQLLEVGSVSEYCDEGGAAR